jgi:neutral amino acid transport system substrate-binding protein
MFTKLTRGALGLLLLGGAAGCTEDVEPVPEGVRVGLLLPFTGTASATASNLERAALMAADRVNQAGGIDGKPMRIISRDTHSDPERGVEAARELAALGAVAVIGPESSQVAEELAPVLAEEKVLFLSPFVGAAADPGRTCASPWFRLAPSAKSLGESLAKQASSKGVKKVAVFHSDSPYDRALGGAAATRFTQLGGMVAVKLELDPNAQSYAHEVRAAIDAGVNNVILATSPRAGAIVINEFDALSRTEPRWFLSPLLKTDLLVQNVAPQALEGAMGVAPKIYERDGAFPKTFSDRWLGDQPLEGAYFYYDATALLAIALAKTAYSNTESELNSVMLEAAGPPGEQVRWDELDVGVERQSKGEPMYYTGLSGPLRLERCGARTIGITSSWTVAGGYIIDDVED